MPEPRPSLRRRLLKLLVLGTGGVWLAIATITFFDARFHAGRLFDAQLVGYAEMVGAIAEHEVYEIAGRTTKPEHLYAQELTYQVFSLSGDLLMRSETAPTSPLAWNEGFSDQEMAGRGWRVYRRTDGPNMLVVIVAHRSESRELLARGVAMWLVVPLLLGLPLIGGALWIAVSRSLTPLRKLAGDIASRRPGQLTPVDARDAPAEIQPLVQALNDLLARLERAFAIERGFTGDAAHELRTPLAALKTQAEVALTTANDERRRRALQQVVAGADRATRLVEQMLALARLDAADARFESQVDLVALAHEVAAESRRAAEARGVSVSVRGDADTASVAGDDIMLHALARNLAENALRHAPQGGEVRLEVDADEARVRFSLEDSGPGVPPELRSRIFDRFFRVPGQESGAGGLGLAMAKRIVELHHGEIRAEPGLRLPGLRVVAEFDRVAQGPVSSGQSREGAGRASLTA